MVNLDDYVTTQRDPSPDWVDINTSHGDDTPGAQPPATQESVSWGRHLIACVKILAAGGILLDGAFHWLEGGAFINLFDFMLDDFFDVENDRLSGPVWIQAMQTESLVAHGMFLLGLTMLVVLPLRLAPGSLLDGLKQIKDLRFRGVGEGITYLIILFLVAMLILTVVLAIQGGLGAWNYPVEVAE